jgi:hypothetical protein
MCCPIFWPKSRMNFWGDQPVAKQSMEGDQA